jgi:Ca2+-binding RTX toxin-like protein
MYSKSTLSVIGTESFDPFARSAAIFDHSALRPLGPFDPGGPITQNVYTGTTGNDNFTGTSGDDTFDLTQGGNDSASGKGGTDYFNLGAALTPQDKIDGGGNAPGYSDEVELKGDYSAGMTFNASTITGIEFLMLNGSNNGGGSYDLTLNDGNVAASDAMLIWFYGAAPTDFFRLDASAETDGDLYLRDFGAGIDIFIGGAGNDLFYGGSGGNDSFDGGAAGSDRVSFSASATGVTVSLATQGVAQDVGGGQMVTLNHIEDLSGSVHDDTLTGNDEINAINTNGGGDTVQCAGGDDYVNVTMITSAVSITIDGGADNDTLSLVLGAVNHAVTFSLALQGSAQLIDGTESVTATNFESVSATLLDDSLTGDSNGNTLYGNAGNDVLSGGDGDDTLYGDAFYTYFTNGAGRAGFAIFDSAGGRDTLLGGDGNDILYGGASKDKLIGGAGHDTLNGDAGADTFVSKKASDSGVGAGNRDVMDFSQSDHDRINLHGIDADTTTGGNQDFHLGGGVFTNSAGELIQFSDGSGHTIVAGDINGDGTADFEIQLTTAPTLVVGDFVF